MKQKNSWTNAPHFEQIHTLAGHLADQIETYGIKDFAGARSPQVYQASPLRALLMRMARAALENDQMNEIFTYESAKTLETDPEIRAKYALYYARDRSGVSAYHAYLFDGLDELVDLLRGEPFNPHLAGVLFVRLVKNYFALVGTAIAMHERRDLDVALRAPQMIAATEADKIRYLLNAGDIVLRTDQLTKRLAEFLKAEAD